MVYKKRRAHRADLLRGTLDLPVLKTLHSGRAHDWDIAQRIRQVSGEVLHVKQGSLYPALHRPEARGSIGSEWDISGNNRRSKFYKLTAAGRRRRGADTENWERFSTAIGLILQNT